MNMKREIGADGDFAYAYVIAHEVGHHVQNLLGTLGQVHSRQQRVSEAEKNQLSVRLELQADFYAGVWAYYDNQLFGSLEDGDIEEGLAVAAKIGDDYQALGMPYGNGSYQMTVLLPKQKNGANINALPEIPDAERWQQINSNMRSVTVDVKLPRFETSTDIDLKEIMAKLGMPDAFDGGRADFSNFCDKPTYIGLMKQVAKIKLDEEGSEAAAVTVIGMKVTSAAPPAKEIVFHANHPFLYIISEKNSGAIFFMGQDTGY